MNNTQLEQLFKTLPQLGIQVMSADAQTIDMIAVTRMNNIIEYSPAKPNRQLIVRHTPSFNTEVVYTHKAYSISLTDNQTKEISIRQCVPRHNVFDHVFEANIPSSHQYYREQEKQLKNLYL